jgi:hypothetical protein
MALHLARTLPAQALLTQYYAIGHASLGNYVALVSGQAPNEATQMDCPTSRISRPAPPGSRARPVAGTGRVYPPMVKICRTSWKLRTLLKAYMEDMART